MSNGGNAIRGSRIGAGPMGEADRGYKAERVTKIYYCANGHEHNRIYAATILAEEIPELSDCPSCGDPSGLDKDNPPVMAKHEPYKTHLAYVKERRTEEEAEALLSEAVASVRERRLAAAAAAAAAQASA